MVIKMKIRVVSSKDEIASLNPRESIIHLTFRPSNKDIFNLVKNCTDLKAIHIPSSYKKTISEATGIFLSMQGIKLLEGDVWGHRKDINEYSEVGLGIYDRINALKSEGLSDEAIAGRINKESRISKDLVKYILENQKK
ncbi:MAG: hypothetical protein EMLJLAPB_00938 [Candidatus Argoarchaeum ethanivorans]|uniref:DUF1699 family protein n=1 Tax=Candidatus Argoarchaeum ethanivorans TaxID=2608793 RepID=A0A811T7G1_9EURY|nr:MAG: hypothetical protein FFODKBPE_00475 [Candidatus Argoarchaeum ethanivorans]CAD6494771.1 MAG: hypothetical protein EMLJLAPB_00938 [Candidatus Argoarchaeum ethanivorans]